MLLITDSSTTSGNHPSCRVRPSSMTHATRLLPLIVSLCLAFAACGTPEPSNDAAGSDAEASLDGAWILATGTVDGDRLALNPQWQVTMTVEGTDIGGRAACNSYGGSFSLADGAFSLGDIAQTEMACEPDVMNLEATFIDGLLRVTAASRSGDTATLVGDDVEYEFTVIPPVPTSDLLGTTWVLDSIIQGEAVSSTYANAEQATLHLAGDGTFTGGTGCRSVSGEYVIAGDTVQFTSWGAEGECPSDLVDQDNQVIAVFDSGFTVDITGDRLTITASGAEGLTFTASR